jgi:hypothetical protein
MWVMWNLTSFHMIVPLGDEAQVEAHFGSLGDSANVDARYVHGLRRTCHRLENCFGHTR